MRTYKVFSINKNGSQSIIPPTSLGVDGVLTSLKKDGTTIKGRMPTLEEDTLLWRFALTSQEKLPGNNHRLFSKIYIPEEGIDFEKEKANDDQKRMIGLYRFLSRHQYIQRFETTMVNGEQRRVQVNKNFGRNPTLVYEMTDETAQEELNFQKDRLVTKCLSMVDEVYDQDEEGTGAFLDMCFGMNVSLCYKNVKKRNYNVLADKIRLNPMAFQSYWDDPDRAVMITINKGKKLGGENPYISQDKNGCYFYKDVLIGSSDGELKLYFKNNPDEYQYLKRMVGEVSEVSMKEDITYMGKLDEVIEPTINTEKREVSPIEKEFIPKPRANNLPETNQNIQRGAMNREIGIFIGLLKKAQDDNNDRQLEGLAFRLTRAREKFSSNIDYFNGKLHTEATKKGVVLPETVSV